VSAPSKEEIERVVYRARNRAKLTWPEAWSVIVALAEERDRLQRELDEAIGMLDEAPLGGPDGAILAFIEKRKKLRGEPT